MPKILHFADSHIDMDNYGRQDPGTGMPLRVMDFLKPLDQIVIHVRDQLYQPAARPGDRLDRYRSRPGYSDSFPSKDFGIAWDCDSNCTVSPKGFSGSFYQSRYCAWSFLRAGHGCGWWSKTTRS
ncbi:MAG: hypothetical protein RAP03_11750 [Candidatus Electryonea clarkiae]|nr:hypothetical protein [Candidatus Electryonea clarkiae]